MAHRPPDDSADARRRKFLQSFQNFDANSRFPAPYAQFAGRRDGGPAQLRSVAWFSRNQP